MLTVLPSRPTSARLFRRDARGIAAVEFAIILPVMLLLYIGIVDVTRDVIASRKLNLLSRTVSDLVSQQPTGLTVPVAKMSTILGAASAVMQPFSSAPISLTVSAVDIRLKSDAKTCCDVVVRWSYTQAGSTAFLRACSTPLTQVVDGTPPSLTNFPQSLVTANSQQQSYSGATLYMIITDAAYVYSPIFPQAASWLGPIRKTTYMVPRAPTNPVTIADPSNVPAPQMGKICFS